MTDVDDLVVISDTELLYAQAKHRLRLAWPEVEQDFKNQLEDLKMTGLDAGSQVELVVSRAGLRKSLDDSMPAAFKGKVEVKHYVHRFSEWRSFAEGLLSKAGGDLAKRNLADYYYIGWKACNFHGTIRDIAKCSADHSGFLLRDFEPKFELSPEVETLLSAVKGMDYDIEGDIFTFGMNRHFRSPLGFRCGTPKWDRLIKRLSNAEDLDLIKFATIAGKIR
ncbi:hypothetical protein GGE45_002582 [Rhizobium aethiopicum]|uniref:Uncharacterized protein n=1 Tax=Rhizobium aethiopicum TaxID=1138170 RepID=A0A7W6Q6H5_9HYPH|nr:hypothetical protein [Rhizobium aethiopicum]MBB4190009.1 hypothetical protein [Rhizobium aethiopicum]MBB4580252.1 hypothetical protein [Rhizobium aethiopicum]